jgi:hypothetical protein
MAVRGGAAAAAPAAAAGRAGAPAGQQRLLRGAGQGGGAGGRRGGRQGQARGRDALDHAPLVPGGPLRLVPAQAGGRVPSGVRRRGGRAAREEGRRARGGGARAGAAGAAAAARAAAGAARAGALAGAAGGGGAAAAGGRRPPGGGSGSAQQGAAQEEVTRVPGRAAQVCAAAARRSGSWQDAGCGRGGGGRSGCGAAAPGPAGTSGRHPPRHGGGAGGGRPAAPARWVGAPAQLRPVPCAIATCRRPLAAAQACLLTCRLACIGTVQTSGLPGLPGDSVQGRGAAGGGARPRRHCSGLGVLLLACPALAWCSAALRRRPCSRGRTLLQDARQFMGPPLAPQQQPTPLHPPCPPSSPPCRLQA